MNLVLLYVLIGALAGLLAAWACARTEDVRLGQTLALMVFGCFIWPVFALAALADLLGEDGPVVFKNRSAK